MQGDVLEHRLVVDITEAHVVELLIAPSALSGSVMASGRSTTSGSSFRELGHALSPGHSVLDVLPSPLNDLTGW